jgi:hypothetical protein
MIGGIDEMTMIELSQTKPMVPNLDPKFEYKRLVIIGNGFDLGLGLKTSYEAVSKN